MINGIELYHVVHGSGEPLLLLRGHGRSAPLSKTFRHEGPGGSGGANVLLRLATKQPARVKAMVLVTRSQPCWPAPRPLPAATTT